MVKKIIDIPFNSAIELSLRYKEILIDITKTAIIFTATVALSEILGSFGFDDQSLIMIYILSVLVISRSTTGYIYGITATVLNTFAYDFFITEPRMGFSFTIGFPITLCVMFFVAFSTSALAIQMKRQTKLALEREQRARLLYEINQSLLVARDLEAIVKITNEYLVGHVQRSVIFYLRDPSIPEAGALAQSPLEGCAKKLFNSEKERKAAHDIYVYPASADISYQLKAAVWYFPVVSKDNVLGLIGVSCSKEPLSQAGVLFTQMLVVQVALALELHYLSEEQKRILVDTEREKTHATLLRAISHDLRTPLTSILGASTTVLEQKNRLDNETMAKLISDIKENAGWLIRIVENLLSITKISNDAAILNKTSEAAEEVAAHSVSIVRKRFPEWDIRINSPTELMLVPMDATLISQVIINLLENSIKNSKKGSLILFEIKNKSRYAEFSISDNGCGIPDQLLDNLFETHSCDKGKSVDSARGMGIGLSICKTIIYAHGGTITGKNKQEGGANFSFSLPLKECDNIG